MINPLHAKVPFLHPLKTSENEGFSDDFRGYRNRTLARKGLIQQSFKELKKETLLNASAQLR